MVRPRDWDPDAYDRISAPQLAWSEEVLDRLPLRGDETVLDAGCGSGTVTERLLERLPCGRVIGVDASPSMLERAAARLGDRVELIESDLAELELPEPVDAVFSNATFHWVGDHEALFQRLAAALRPGGPIEAQCGGRGNVGKVRDAVAEVVGTEPFRRYAGAMTPPWNFATPEQTRPRMEAAGFVGVRCWLEPRPTQPPEPRVFLGTVGLGHYREALPAGLWERFLDRVLERLGPDPVLDYVRLNISARRE